MKFLGERGRWIGVAVAVLALAGIGAALVTANDSNTASSSASAAPAAATTTTTAAAPATTTPAAGNTALRTLHPAAGKFKPDATSVQSCEGKSGDYGCWEQALGNVAFNDGVLKAFDDLHGLLQRDVPAVR